MTIDRMIALLKIEHECMLRKAHDECDGKCEDCELVQDDGELHEMYTDVIGLLEGQKKPEQSDGAEERFQEIGCNGCELAHYNDHWGVMMCYREGECPRGMT